MISIIVICNQIQEEKLNRLFRSLQPQLPAASEVLLLYESSQPQELPSFSLAVQSIPLPPSQGIPFNRNQGIIRSRGKFIIFIDDDCWVPENWLKALLEPLQKDKHILAVTGGTKVPPSNLLGDSIAALGFPGGGSLGFDKVWKVSPEGFTNHLSVGNCALRRELFEQVGYFDVAMKFGAEDTEFSQRLEAAGILVKHVPDACAFHEARSSWSSFVQWQLRRGRANYHFRKKVGKVGKFVQLRAWSAGNVLRANLTTLRFPVVLGLLGSSFALQQWGYLLERWKHG